MSSDESNISVVIPTRNRSDRCVAAIRSAQEQSLKPKEILVCDDGSTDNTREAVEEIAASDPIVKFIASPNGPSGSPAGPRNRGIRNATGSHIAFLDDDDKWLPEKLETQAGVVDASSVIVCTNALKRTGGLYFTDYADRCFNRQDLVRNNPIIMSSVLIARERLVQSGGFVTPSYLAGCADYNMWIRLLGSAGHILRLGEPLAIYDDLMDERLSNRKVHMAAAETLALTGALLKSNQRSELIRPAIDKTLQTGLNLAYDGYQRFRTTYWPGPFESGSDI